MATILIVEENRNLAWIEARILREAGHTRILAAHARSALLGPPMALTSSCLPSGCPICPGRRC